MLPKTQKIHFCCLLKHNYFKNKNTQGSKGRYMIWMGRWQSLQHFAYLSIQDTFTYDPLLLLWTWNENSFSYSTTYCLDPASWIGEDKIYASKSPNVRLYSTFSSRKKKEWESFNLHFDIWIFRIEEVIQVHIS